jgi:hypothetical protein
MFAEMASIEDLSERRRFGAGLLGATLRLLLRDCIASPRMWAVSAAAGAVIPFLDTHADGGCNLVRLIGSCSLALGFLQPRAPWRWGMALILGVAAAARVPSMVGFFDLGDVVPTLVLALSAVYIAAVLRRATRLASSRRRSA